MHAADDGSFLQRFTTATADMDPAQRGAYLEYPPEGAPDIDEAHHVSHSSQSTSQCTTLSRMSQSSVPPGGLRFALT